MKNFKTFLYDGSSSSKYLSRYMCCIINNGTSPCNSSIETSFEWVDRILSFSLFTSSTLKTKFGQDLKFLVCSYSSNSFHLQHHLSQISGQNPTDHNLPLCHLCQRMVLTWNNYFLLLQSLHLLGIFVGLARQIVADVVEVTP